MNENKQQEIQKTIDNPITEKMRTWQEALKTTIAKAWKEKIEPNQISVKLDKWENKIAQKRKPDL